MKEEKNYHLIRIACAKLVATKNSRFNGAQRVIASSYIQLLLLLLLLKISDRPAPSSFVLHRYWKQNMQFAGIFFSLSYWQHELMITEAQLTAISCESLRKPNYLTSEIARKFWHSLASEITAMRD